MSDARIDHAAEARKHLGWVGEFDEGDSQDWPLVNATVAQVHATLALVEQQRIANLIALAAGRSDSFEEALPILYDEAAAALMEFVQSGGSQVSGPEEFPEIRREIREGLGL